MNFIEARSKLKKLAKGKYHTIQYQMSEVREEDLAQECTVYIDGFSHHYGETWELALKSLKNEINPPLAKPVKVESIEEIK